MLSWRMPVNLPSLPAPSVIVWMVAGWWPTIEYICARVSCSRTGRFRTFAASAASRVCGQTYALPPKPPPRNSETTLIFAGGTPSTIDTSSLVPKTCWAVSWSVGVPDGRRHVRLHLVVVAIGRRVGLLDLDGAGRDSTVGLADRRRDRPEELRRVDGVLRRLRAEHHGSLGLILDVDQRAGMRRLVERRGDDERDRLTGVVDLVVLQHQIGLPLRMEVAPGQGRRVHARHVAMGEHRQYARRLFGRGSIDRHRPAVRDGAMDDRGVDRAIERNVCRVMRAARHLE